jgi:membrane protein YdbS with pleckstrin-like domain
MRRQAPAGRHRRREAPEDQGTPWPIRLLRVLLYPVVALTWRWDVPAHESVAGLIAAAAVLLLVMTVVAVVVHEAGHVVAALLARQHITAIRLGAPPARFSFRIRSVTIDLGPRLKGQVAYRPAPMSPLSQTAVTAAGPAANLLSAPLFLLLPVPFWVAGTLALWTAISGLEDLIPVRGSDGHLNDGAKLWRARAMFRADADVRALLADPDWSARTDAFDRLAEGYRLGAPAAADRAWRLGHDDTADLALLSAREWTLPEAPDPEVVSVVHYLSWRLVASGPAGVTDLAASRLEWALEHAGDRRGDEQAAAQRRNVQHSLAVARLRQGRPEAVERLCSDALAAKTTASGRATVLATVALARHELGLSGAAQLAEALALDPEADLVGEAAAALDGQPSALPASA